MWCRLKKNACKGQQHPLYAAPHLLHVRMRCRLKSNACQGQQNLLNAAPHLFHVYFVLQHNPINLQRQDPRLQKVFIQKTPLMHRIWSKFNLLLTHCLINPYFLPNISFRFSCSPQVFFVLTKQIPTQELAKSVVSQT